MHRLYSSTLTATALALVPYISYAQEQGELTVSEVEIVGTRYIHPDLIRLQLRTAAGRRFSLEELREDERAITRMDQFIFLESRHVIEPGNKIKIIIHVKELPYVGSVQFLGIGYWDRSDLPGKIKTHQGGYLNPFVLEADRKALLEHFRKERFLNADIEVTQQVDELTGFVNVSFHIDLGQQIKVDQVHYDGLPEGVYQYHLNQVIINKPSRVFASSQFQKQMLPWDRRAIANLIRDRGYLNATVDEIEVDFYDGLRASDPRRRHGPSVVPDKKLNNRVVLSVNVTPGDRFYLGSVSFVGNSLATETELTEAFAMEVGDIFDNRNITTGIEAARRVIRNKGYPKADIRRDMRIELADPEQGRMQHQVHLTLHISEGQQYRIGRVDIDGNRVTKDAVIRRALDMYPGDTYNEDREVESLRQLRRIGLFNIAPPEPLRIDKVYPPARPDEVDMLVRLEELGTGEVRANAAFSSAENFVLQLSYAERNFDLLGLFQGNPRGGGQTLQVSTSWSEQRSNFNISWSNPHLFDSPYSLSTFVTRSDTSLSANDWDEQRIDTGITIGRRFLRNDLLLSLGYEYSNREISDVEADAPNDALDADGDRFETNSLILRQRYSRLDFPRQPNSGYRIDARETLSGGFLSASDEYYEIAINFDSFIPIAESPLGGITRIHLGQENRWLRPLGDSDRIPFYTRYSGGGPAPRHRGYDSGDLGPRETNRNGFETRQKGTTYWMSTAEIIHPLQGVQMGLQGLVFYDLGYVWEEDQSMELGELRSAAGFGIRFPMQFPIALDFAWRLDNKDDEPGTQFHFSIGGIF